MADWTDVQLLPATQAVLEIISGKWVLPTFIALDHGPRRHNELRREVDPAVHSKVFNETLRRLTDLELIERRVADEHVPPAVYYELRPLTRSLMRSLATVFEWTEENREVVESWLQDPR